MKRIRPTLFITDEQSKKLAIIMEQTGLTMAKLLQQIIEDTEVIDYEQDSNNEKSE